MARLDMPKSKRKSNTQPKKGKRDFGPTAFSGFQKSAGFKVAAQRHNRSSRGK